MGSDANLTRAVRRVDCLDHLVDNGLEYVFISLQ